MQPTNTPETANTHPQTTPHNHKRKIKTSITDTSWRDAKEVKGSKAGVQMKPKVAPARLYFYFPTTQKILTDCEGTRGQMLQAISRTRAPQDLRFSLNDPYKHLVFFWPFRSGSGPCCKPYLAYPATRSHQTTTNRPGITSGVDWYHPQAPTSPRSRFQVPTCPLRSSDWLRSDAKPLSRTRAPQDLRIALNDPH